MARHAIGRGINPAKFDQHQHRQVNFLDLEITLVYSCASDFAFRVYRKPGTAYAYLLRILPREARLSRLAQCRDAQAADALQQP